MVKKLLSIFFVHLICAVVYSQNYISIGENSAQYPKIDSIIAPYKKIVDEEMERVIGYNHQILEKPLSVYFANFALKEQASEILLAEKNSKKNAKIPDLSFLTSGGIRRSLDVGEITVGDLYEIMPFDNKLALIPADYLQIQCLVELKNKKKNLVVEGLEINNKNIKINGEIVKKNKKYLIATIDYLALGGDEISCFLENPDLEIREDWLFRDLLIRYIESEKDLRYPKNTAKNG